MKLQLLSASRIVLITFIFSVMVMFLMRKVAVHVNAIDKPTDAEGKRHIHKKETPKFG